MADRRHPRQGIAANDTRSLATSHSFASCWPECQVGSAITLSFLAFGLPAVLRIRSRTGKLAVANDGACPAAQYPVWTARRVQVGLRDTGLGSNSVICPAFDAGPSTGGPDGIRERPPNNRAAFACHWYKRSVPLVGSTDSHLLLALKSSAAARGSGGDRLTPIRFPTRHHGPDDPGHLVGQSDRGELALQQ
jgi:hypothetical protein